MTSNQIISKPSFVKFREVVQTLLEAIKDSNHNGMMP